jgi:ABC-type transport system substrate-binding protein
LLRYPKNGDLEKAKELMAKAGVKGYEVEVICSDKDWLLRELELVAAMVSQIGIKYKIRNLDIGSFNNLWLNRKFEQLLEDITIVAPDQDATVGGFCTAKAAVHPGTIILKWTECWMGPERRATRRNGKVSTIKSWIRNWPTIQ